MNGMEAVNTYAGPQFYFAFANFAIAYPLLIIPVSFPFRMPQSLTRKNDLIIWLHMSDTQQKIYKDFLGLERVKEVCF